jgi:hypothetical protein
MATLRVVRGPEVDDVLCCAREVGGEIVVYLPCSEISHAAALALGAVLSEVLAPPLAIQARSA